MTADHAFPRLELDAVQAIRIQSGIAYLSRNGVTDDAEAIAELLTNWAELAADVEWLRGANTKLDAARGALAAEVERLTKARGEAWEAHDDVEAECDAARARIAELEAEVRRLEEVNTRAAEQIFKLAERQAYGGNPLTLDVPGSTP